MSKGAQFLTCRKYGGYRARGGQGRIEVKRSGTAQCLRRRSDGRPHGRGRLIANEPR
jgi:hypothetical protein